MKMTFSTLENNLLMEVTETPRSVVGLYSKYVEKTRCSRAGFYKALASLKKKEVIIEKNHTVSINKIWLAESYDFFRKLVHQKTMPSYLAREVAHLNKEDRLSYTFHSIAEIDIFILNLLYDLLLLKVDTKVLIVEPHEFFVLLNDSRTKQIMKELSTLGGKVHLLIEGGTQIDKEVARKFLPKPAQGYVIKADNRKSVSVLHVVSDVCIELKLNKQILASLDHLFKTHEELTDEFQANLKELLSKRMRHEIVITRDENKAARAKGRFKKYF